VTTETSRNSGPACSDGEVLLDVRLGLGVIRDLRGSSGGIVLNTLHFMSSSKQTGFGSRRLRQQDGFLPDSFRSSAQPFGLFGDSACKIVFGKSVENIGDHVVVYPQGCLVDAKCFSKTGLCRIKIPPMRMIKAEVVKGPGRNRMTTSIFLLPDHKDILSEPYGF
jgi:hypothetical protein